MSLASSKLLQRCALAWLLLSALGAGSSTVRAQSYCPDETPMYCSNCNGYCCDSAHPWCTSDCGCSASSDSCPASAPLACGNCGGYCCPTSQPYCTSSCTCSESNSADPGGGASGTGGASGGECPPGTYACGPDFCVNNDVVCCESVGYPGVYCPGGTSCMSDGTCSDGSGPGGGGEPGSGCTTGTFACGADYCAPSGTNCCASVGHPEMYCDSGATCTPNGTCVDSTGATTTSNTGTQSGSTQGGVTTEGEYTCSPISSMSCNTRFCLTSDLRTCYYEVDGEKVVCDACTSTDTNDGLTQCAKRAVDLCSPKDSSDDSGCTAAGSGNPSTGAWLALSFAALWSRRRRARSRTAVE